MTFYPVLVAAPCLLELTFLQAYGFAGLVWPDNVWVGGDEGKLILEDSE